MIREHWPHARNGYVLVADAARAGVVLDVDLGGIGLGARAAS